MGTFALAEAFMMVLKPSQSANNSLPTTDLGLDRQEIREIAPVVGRSSVLGFLVGVLPGAGATIASFLAYGMERGIASTADKAQFGKGSLKGLAAPESANNAACTGSFVPLLTLGIPGSGTTAILLGALIAYGIQPGPRLYIDQPEIFWSVIVSMYFGNMILLFLNLPLIPYIAKLLTIPRTFLIPLIGFFSLTGVYLVSFNPFDLQLMLYIAVCAVILRLMTFPMAPVLLGFILGGMLEDNLRRAITLSDGNASFLWERPTTLCLLVLTVIALMSPLLRMLMKSALKGFKDKQNASRL
jgi:putative tricarboxylic transport membrane protein